MHSIILVTKELLPWGLVALGDGGDIELLVGDFFEGARVPCAEDRQCELLGPQPGCAGGWNSPTSAWPWKTCYWGRNAHL